MEQRDLTKILRAALEAFVVGDALGAPVEYMPREEIIKRLGFIDNIVDPQKTYIHQDLPKASITDDTSQLMVVWQQYVMDHKVTLEGTVKALLRWYREAPLHIKKRIGPTSAKALERLAAGESPEVTGVTGITCGGAMRVPAVALCTPRGEYVQLAENVYVSLLPTHNTNIALEAATALAFAIHAAMEGMERDKVIAKAFSGAAVGRKRGATLVGASTLARLEVIMTVLPTLNTPERLMYYLYNVIGTEMTANQVVPVVFGLSFWAWQNPWQAIKMGASLGGDTDTIAALAGFLATLLNAGNHLIPPDIVDYVLTVNNINIQQLVESTVDLFWKV
jgi:ADP-ribosylglycohydrolase